MKSLLILSSVIATILSQTNFQEILDNFSCFDEPKKNYFQNDPTTEITDLPQVRIMMCGYESQCALEFAAYLFMKEKLGMNVTFYPTLDYDSVWNGEFWGGWSDPVAYPKYYFEWLASDSMDLNFEFWPTQLVRTNSDGEETFNGETDYILPGLIDFGGFVGAYGEESIWVPKYFVEQYTDGFIPHSILTTTLYRELMINASANGATDYINKYNTTGVYNISHPVYYNRTRVNWTDPVPFDRPTYDKPIVWGSVPSYFMSEYANDLIKNYPLNGGMDVSFVTTGSESSLASLVADLYSQRAPFMANIYTLDINFGRIDSGFGELQQF
eukprot:362054_1